MKTSIFIWVKSSFFVFGLVFLLSCNKDNVLKQETRLEQRDINYSTDYRYFSNTTQVASSAYESLLSDTTRLSFIYLHSDTVNFIDYVDNFSFSNQSNYFSYTDGVLGLDESSDFSKSEQIKNYLNTKGYPVGVKHVSNADSLYIINNILNPAVVAFSGGGNFYKGHNCTEKSLSIDNNKLIYFPPEFTNSISSYKPEPFELFRSIDKFYDKAWFIGHLYTVYVDKRGNPHRYVCLDFLNMKVDDRADSFYKRRKL